MHIRKGQLSMPLSPPPHLGESGSGTNPNPEVVDESTDQSALEVVKTDVSIESYKRESKVNMDENPETHC